MAVPDLGDSATPDFGAAGVLTGHQAEVRHQLGL